MASPSAHSLLFGPRRGRKIDGSISRAALARAEKGQAGAVIAYLKPRKPYFNDDYQDLAATLVESFLAPYSGDEAFELQPDQNEAVLIESASVEEERAALGRYLLDNIDNGDGEELVFQALWQSSLLGPLTLRFLAGQIEEDERIDSLNIFGLLTLAYPDKNKRSSDLFAALHNQLAWQLLRESEDLGQGILAEFGVTFSHSNIFGHDKLDFSGGGNIIHFIDNGRFACGAKAERILPAIRGAWHNSSPEIGNMIYERCDKCQDLVKMEPGCEDMYPSLLGWDSYERELKTIRTALWAYYQQLSESNIAADDLEDEIEERIGYIHASARDNIQHEHSQEIAGRLFDFFEDKASRELLIDSMWGEFNLGQSDDTPALTSLKTPSQPLLQAWAEEALVEETRMAAATLFGNRLAAFWGLA